MRFFILCLVAFLASSTALGLTLDPSLRYEKDFTKTYTGFPAAFDSVMAKRAFTKLVGNNSGQPISTLDLMSRVFIPRTFSRTGDRRMIFALSGLKIPSAIQFNEIYDLASGYAIHFRTSGSGDIALYFENFDIATVREIKLEFSKMQKRIARAANSSLIVFGYRNLVTEASAQNAPVKSEIDFRYMNPMYSLPALCGGERKQAPTAEKSEASLLSSAWGCSKGIAAGIWDATGGAAWFVVSGVGNAIIHPVETFARVGGSLLRIMDAMADINGAFGDLKATYSSLPPEVKAKVGCEIVSMVGTTALVTYLTAGAGSPLFLRTVSQALSKVSAALPAGSASAAQTAELATKMMSKSTQVQEMQTLIASGSAGKEFVEKTKQFDDAAKGISMASKDMADSASYIAAVAARDALQKENPALMKAIYQARQATGFRIVNEAAHREKILAELKKAHKLTPAQEVAVYSYLTAQTCNGLETANEAVPAQQKGVRTSR